MKIYAAVVDCYDVGGTAAKTLYFCSKSGFNSEAGDAPARTHFVPRLIQPTEIDRTIFSAGKTMGKSRTGHGELVLDNHDGGLDYLLDYAFDGRDLVVYYGDDTAAFPAAWDVVGTGTMTQPELKLGTLTLKVRDRQELLNVPIQTTKYAGDNALPAGLEGVAGDLKGKPKPLCYGVVKNVAPPCVNTSKLIYQVNDGAVDTVDAVYDSGIKLGKTYDSWTNAANPVVGSLLYGGAYSDYLDIAIMAGTFGGGGGKAAIITSANGGANWTSRAPAVLRFGQICKSVAAGNNIVLVAGSDTITGVQPFLNRSVDGTTWTEPALGAPVGTGACEIIFFGDGVFVLGANTNGGANVGEIYTSTDGNAWTLRKTTGTQLFHGHYGNGVYIMGDGNGDVWISTDNGVNWSAAAIPTGLANAIYSGTFALE